MSPITSTQQTLSPERVQQMVAFSISQQMRKAGVLNSSTEENWDYTAIK